MSEKSLTTKNKNKPEGYTFGRSTKYKKEYCKDIVDFFEKEHTETVIEVIKKGRKMVEVEKEVPSNYLPTLAGWARKMEIDTVTILNWGKKHRDFFSAIKRCKAIQEDLLLQRGLKGIYNRTITIFALKNLAKWKDKHEIDLNATLKPVTINKLDGSKEVLGYQDTNTIEGEYTVSEEETDERET